MNTQEDLRQEVARRLRETLDGKTIDTSERGMPKLPHMLGIVRFGAIPTARSDKGSFLDNEHEFWQNYEETVRTRGAVRRKVENTVSSLKEDGVFRVDVDGDEISVEVDEV